MPTFSARWSGSTEEIVRLYQAIPQAWFGLGIDAVSAQDAWGMGYPGFAGLHLDPTPGRGMNRDTIRNREAENYFFHFPDGNASIARLLVRQLIPDAIPGSSAADVVLARANYAALDRPSSPVRIRLNSTVVKVRHRGSLAGAKEVEISYARGGKVYTVRAAHAILGLLACGHSLYLRRTAGAAEKSPVRSRQGSAFVHQRRPAQLDRV